jgi:hypothetical protein
MATQPTLFRTGKAILKAFLLYGGIAVAIVVAFTLWLGQSVPSKARRISCVSSLRNLGIATVQYTQDNDGEYPNVGPSGTGWASALFPYSRTVTDFQCPQDVQSTEVGSAERPISYSMNSNLIAGHPAKSSACAQTVMMFETGGAHIPISSGDKGDEITAGSDGAGVGNGLPPSPGSANLTANGSAIHYACGAFLGRPVSDPAYRPGRHGGQAYFLSSDGHVALLPGSRISTDTTPDRSGPQTGSASGTAATADNLGDSISMTFSAL